MTEIFTVLLGFLRASGGVSFTVVFTFKRCKFSPRKRRCFLNWTPFTKSLWVFSAQAEVFLSHSVRVAVHTCFLRASGGVSQEFIRRSKELEFSPRKRRCFQSQSRMTELFLVFSAQAEVFLYPPQTSTIFAGFLRASGGVSTDVLSLSRISLFSPRKRRCFLMYICGCSCKSVFSA